MSSSDPGATVQLTVQGADAGTEIFVSDSHFQLVGRGLGEYLGVHPPGIYQVRLRAGFATRDDVVLLPVGETKVHKIYPPLEFGTPVPLAETAAAPGLPSAAMEQSRKVNKLFGHGASIFVFVRPAAGQAGHPARGLALVNARRKIVADFAKDSDRGPVSDSWAACTVEVDPGNYLLRLELPDGAVEQSLLVGQDWQLQVFLQAVTRQEGSGPDLCGAAIMYARDRKFDPTHPEGRLSELTRLGLTNRRQGISATALDSILAGNFQNPMLGLFGAHLALETQPNRVRSLLPEVVQNLRRLLTASNPDVEALALLLDDRANKYQFDWPPMLRRSWALVVRESGKRAGLIRPGGLADQMAARVWGQEPWLQWRKPLRRSSDAISFSIMPEDEATEVYQMALKAHLEAMLLPQGLHSGGRRVPIVGSAVPTVVEEQQLQQLVGALGLPRPHIETMLRGMGLTISQPLEVKPLSPKAPAMKHAIPTPTSKKVQPTVAKHLSPRAPARKHAMATATSKKVRGPHLEPYQVIIRPLITEKTTHQSTHEHHNAYTFQVNLWATKDQIKHAVQELFNVRVENVRTQLRQGKKRRFRFKVGKLPNWKKAIVKLHKEDKIDFI